MSVYSKIIVSNGTEYIVPIQPSTLMEGKLVNKDGEIFNKFVLVPHIDVETGNEMHIALNPQYIVTIEEVHIKRNSHISSVVNVKLNMYIFACLSMYKINHFLC